MYIYSVARWNPVHAPCCESTWRNKGFEKYRTRVKGCFLSEDKAKEYCAQLSKSDGTKYFVEKHKIMDSNNYSNFYDNI